MGVPVLFSALTNTVVQVRGHACVLESYSIVNPAAATTFIQMFDSLATPTLGTTVPTLSLGVPTIQSETLQADTFFQLGLWVAATTTATGNGAPATAATVNLTMSSG